MWNIFKSKEKIKVSLEEEFELDKSRLEKRKKEVLDLLKFNELDSCMFLTMLGKEEYGLYSFDSLRLPSLEEWKEEKDVVFTFKSKYPNIGSYRYFNVKYNYEKITVNSLINKLKKDKLRYENIYKLLKNEGVINDN